ncbi:MAG: MacS family sensor histidine kinase [Propionibacteriaceae bacterium]
MDLLWPLFRAHTVMRLVLVLMAWIVNGSRLAAVEQPWALLVASILMLLWSMFTSWMYVSTRRRQVWVFAADMVVTIALVLSSEWILGADIVNAHQLSVPGYWLAAAPVAIALWRGWIWGGIAAAVAGGAALLVDPNFAFTGLGPVLVLVLICVGVGYFVNAVRQTTAEREQMYMVAAGMAERQRLARVVHDGVLQVLALVEREGRQMGPRGAQLAREARQQEGALRALLQDTDIDVASPEPSDLTHRNLSVVLDRHSAPQVTISTPAGTVLVESGRASEIDAAVAEALSNIEKHAGHAAQAWVLLEREDNDIIVSIRDNGVGGTANQFEDAFQRGRMGMRHSIYGRLHDIGGVATLRTAPGRGVEWEFRIPVE